MNVGYIRTWDKSEAGETYGKCKGISLCRAEWG